MMKGLGFDESMSNLTSTISGETSISSNARNNDQSSSPTTATATVNAATNTILYPQASSSSFASPHEPPQLQPSKKKRGLPGNPDPDAEVIALSPKSLLATNRFICEICNKGFQRDQNLQLHRRGHNLPWKLKQRAKDQIIRKKVYVCPEPSCVHHDPSRALGDLTGVKKHFSRKHGEKKWKCDKCSKKYAVKSDWKAHSKICGTKEYRCDCGTLFSRRDSFITHRAFCDALAEESARAINPLINTFHPLVSNQTNTSHSNVLSHLTLPSHLTSQLLQSSLPLKQEQPDHHYHHHNHHSNSNFISSRSDIPPWLACPPPPPQQQEMVGGGAQYQLDNNQPSSHMYTFQQHQQSHEFEQQCSSNNNRNSNSNSNAIMGPTLSSFHAPMNPQMSATALLQKAAEMGVTVSTNHSHPQLNNHHQHQLVLPNSTSCGLTVDPRYLEQGQVAPPTEGVLPGGGGGGGRQQSSILHDVMLLSSFQSTPQPAVSGSGFNNSNFEDFHHAMTATKSQLNCGSGGGGGGGSGGGGNDGLTRDFLGLRTFPHKDFGNMARLGGHHMNTSSNSLEQKHDIHQNQTPW